MGSAVLATRGVSVRFGGVHALADVDFEAGPGKRVCMRAMPSEEWSSLPATRALRQGVSPKGSRSCLLARRSMVSGVSAAAICRRVLFWKPSREPLSSRMLKSSRARSKCSGVSLPFTAKSGWASTWAMPWARR